MNALKNKHGSVWPFKYGQCICKRASCIICAASGAWKRQVPSPRPGMAYRWCLRWTYLLQLILSRSLQWSNDKILLSVSLRREVLLQFHIMHSNPGSDTYNSMLEKATLPIHRSKDKNKAETGQETSREKLSAQ